MKYIIKNAFYLIFCIIVVGATVFLTKKFSALRPQTLPFVGSMLEPFSHEGVQISAKAYSSRESMIYLNRDLLHRGLQPLQITIQNNTGKAFYLSNEGLDLPNVASQAVAGEITRSAIPRSIAFRIAGFFFWPLLIPGTIDNIITMKTYFEIKQDYYAKSIKDHPELIVPYSTVNRVIFLPAHQPADEFTLYLQETKSGFFQPYPVEILG